MRMGVPLGYWKASGARQECEPLVAFELQGTLRPHLQKLGRNPELEAPS